jgi:hypothetical protein
MENQVVVREKQGKTFLAKAAATSALVLASASSFAAAPDVTEVAASLTELIAPIGVVGAAYLGVRVAIRGWKVIRGVV